MSDAPKVSREQVERAIHNTTYTVLPDGRTTICQLTLDNGFTVEGASACVSKENFDEALGREYSFKRAFDEAWKMLGMRLADLLMIDRVRESWDYRQRMLHEVNEVGERLVKLRDFLRTNAFMVLTEHDRKLLTSQCAAMQEYVDILNQRIEGAQT